MHAHTWVSSLFSFHREGLDDLACLLACFDTAENEPCKVCPLSAYRSPRLYVKVASLGRSYALSISTRLGPPCKRGDRRKSKCVETQTLFCRLRSVRACWRHGRSRKCTAPCTGRLWGSPAGIETIRTYHAADLSGSASAVVSHTQFWRSWRFFRSVPFNVPPGS